LKLTLASLQEQGSHEKAQMEEQIRRDEERLEEHRQLILRELDCYAKATAALCEDVESALLESPFPCVTEQHCPSIFPGKHVEKASPQVGVQTEGLASEVVKGGA